MLNLNNCAKFEIAKQCFNQELAFRIQNRRNKLVGLWVAAQLDMSDEAANAYAKWVVSEGIDEPRDEGLLQRIAANSSASGVCLNETAIRTEMERLARIAALEYAASELPPQPKAA